MSEFFCLSYEYSESLMARKLPSGVPIEIVRCPVNSQHWSTGKQRLDALRGAPLSGEVKHNKRDEMMIWVQVSGECLVHDRVTSEMRLRGFTGLELGPATIRFRDGQVSSDYKRLDIRGWGGQAHPESGVRLVEKCPACPVKSYGKLIDATRLIDESQWSGEDFFMVWPLYSYIFVTKRVVEYLESAKVRSYKIYRVEELAGAAGKWGFGVRSLKEYLPDDLAERYGGPLGIL